MCGSKITKNLEYLEKSSKQKIKDHINANYKEALIKCQFIVRHCTLQLKVNSFFSLLLAHS